jgi:hypothetical protein
MKEAEQLEVVSIPARNHSPILPPPVACGILDGDTVDRYWVHARVHIELPMSEFMLRKVDLGILPVIARSPQEALELIWRTIRKEPGFERVNQAILEEQPLRKFEPWPKPADITAHVYVAEASGNIFTYGDLLEAVPGGEDDKDQAYLPLS